MLNQHQNLKRGSGLIIFISSFVLMTSITQAESSKKDEAAQLNDQLIRLIETVRHNYVDDDKITYARLYQGAMKGVMESLDKHCHLFLPDPIPESSLNTRGQIGGIGIEISLEDGALTILSPIAGSPGYKAGLLPGDVVIGIDDETTNQMSFIEAIHKLRGKPGSKVTLKIKRSNTDEILEIPIIRDIIKLPSVKGATIKDHNIGYIRITQFSQSLAEELQKKIEKLNGKGMKALLLDLRNNPGGLLSSAIDVSQLFLKKGTLILVTRGQDKSRRQEYRAKGTCRYPDLPLAILINRGSGGSSEIVAGALQDHKRAIIVGERSLGKGTMQSILPLGDKTVIRLTTGIFYTPDGRVIDKKGIDPDVIVTMSPEKMTELWLQRRQLPEEKGNKRLIDPQIDKAIKALKAFMGRRAKDN